MCVNERPRAAIHSHRDLLVWRRAMDLVLATYRLTKGFPADERYSLVQQLRRAAVSVPSNIAEGHGRTHLGDYLRHLSIARGSVMELETQVLIAGRLGYVSKPEEDRLLVLAAQVGRMLSGLLRVLKKRYRSPQQPTPRT